MQTLAVRTIENPLLKNNITFLETSAETGGKCTALLLELDPKGGNELHCHKSFDAIFTVREGQLGIQLCKEVFVLETGESVRLKTRAFYRCCNPPETQKTVVQMVLDTGNRGMEIGTQVAYGLARNGRTTKRGIPKNPYHIALLTHWTDTNAPGFFTLPPPLLRWLYKRAVKKGIDKRLLEQYVKV